ncbi:MAG: urea ABC transporter ATP-binding protein UrtD [Nitrospirae bacterium]|nr:urea ABC transporter ATP-binding protein UrtD [Nitrospirota bacterium]
MPADPRSGDSRTGGSDGTILYLEGVSVSFEGFRALNNLNFVMRKGELRFVIGPNGAGKTTLLDVVCGKVKPIEGRVLFSHYVDLLPLREYEIAQYGIGRKFQTPTIFPDHTVFENVGLSLTRDRRIWSTFFSRYTPAEREKVDSILERVGLLDMRASSAGILSHGQKQWLEIAMLIAQEPQVLLLDEPVAGMTGDEREATGRLIEWLARRHSVLVIEHDMHFVRQFARTVTVLHEGSVLCEGPMQKIQEDPRVIEVYLGRE